MMHIASCSFGKDSLATILLALEHNEPLDRVVFVEVMYDASRGISGEEPEHIEWIYNVAKPRLEAMGVKVDIVRAETDYYQTFHHIRVKGKHVGQKIGFPLAGRCIINRYCKIQAIRDYYKQFAESITQYVGIAIDEPKRLARAESKGQVSLLAKYSYTEAMAKELCRQYGLLSPIYASHNRGGCWFCPNKNARYFAELRKTRPELWQELLRLDAEDNLPTHAFGWDGITIRDIETKMNAMEQQLRLFD